MIPRQPILIVDDNASNLELIKKLLEKEGVTNTIKCSDSRKVMAIFDRLSIELALFDLDMPEISGQELLQQVKSKYPDIPIIIVTGSADINMAVDCMKSGAFDFVTKPIEKDLLIAAVNRALKVRRLEHELSKMKAQKKSLKHPEAFSRIITQSKKMIEVFNLIESVAPSPRSVLITGETGVGKELIAQVIHNLSGRAGNYVTVNAAGLDDNLFSDALFGHVKGAFTGADRDKKGIVEQAENGTVFLDEIGDLNMTSQIKLLRLLQENEYLPLGAEKLRKSSVRIIAATNKNLWGLQDAEKFREDLNYRLRNHHIHIPALKDRLEDLPLLVDHFLEQAALELNKKKPTVPNELYTLLETYPFPGNVRELQSMIFDAVSNHTSKMLSLQMFKKYILPKREYISDHSTDLITFHDSLPSLKQATRLLIEETMRRANNNQSVAAAMLGISQSALSRRLKGSD